MSPKFYTYLWSIYFISAGIMWMAGSFTLVAVVVFGFVAFGMVFTGMMCVLPGDVSHPTREKVKISSQKKAFQPGPEEQGKGGSGFSISRSA